MSGLRIAGWACRFHEEDLVGDTVLPGAFTASLVATGPHGVAMKLRHAGPNVGRWDLLQERPAGLWAEGVLNESWIEDRTMAALIREKAITGLSIGFRAVRWKHRGSARVLREVALVEVSLVAFPLQPRARLVTINDERIAA